MRIATYLLAVTLLGQTSLAQASSPQLEITLKHNDPAEQQTRRQLQRLLSAHDLSRWVFTRKVIIESGSVIPHSHPVLTLSTRHLKDDELLLSTFVHEQLHWHLEQNPRGTGEAVKELRTLFPKVPVGFPEGARSEESSYEHLLVCYLEYQAGRELLGELRARQVTEFWATDHYTWIYRMVLEQGRKIGGVIHKHRLLPSARA